MPDKNQNESSPRARGISLASALGYTFPKLHEGKVWYVDFFALNPLTGIMKRKKYNIPVRKNLRDRRDYASQIIFELTGKLRSGWSPWTGGGESQKTISWDKVCDDYTNYIKHLMDSETIKVSSYENYTSYFRAFRRFINRTYSVFAFAHQLSKSVITDFLDYLIQEQDVSARTRNNYQVWLYGFCSWLQDKGILSSNPAEGIKKLKEADKFREQLKPEDLSLLRSHLQKTDKHFLLACLFEYYAFIRPEELCSVKIGDISVKDMKISLHGEFTKNRKDAAVGLNEEILKLMIDLGTFESPSDFYLFGTRDFFPSQRKQSGRIFRERFVKLRKELNWPSCYQFYSLKDTGIRDMSNKLGVVTARDQARHSDISTTNKYLKADACTVHEATKHFKGSL